MINKFSISILNSKWSPIKRNIKILFLPRKGEFIYLENQYYEVINIVHTITEKQDVFIIVKEIDYQSNIENDELKKD